MVTRFLIKFGLGLSLISVFRWIIDFVLTLTTKDLAIIGIIGIGFILLGFIYSCFEINEVEHE